MGVHDFSCIICGIGEQNITDHSKCHGRHLTVDADDEIFNSDDEILESHDEYECHGAEGVLICFDLPDDVEDPKEAYELLRKGKVQNIKVRRPEYSWDAWDFMDQGEPMGYMKLLRGDDQEELLYLPWKTSNEYDGELLRELHPYKKHFWCMAFCYQCFDTFLSSSGILDPVILCSEYCNYIRQANDIDPNDKREIYSIIRDKFSWLRALVEAKTRSPEYRLNSKGFVNVVFG